MEEKRSYLFQTVSYYPRIKENPCLKSAHSSFNESSFGFFWRVQKLKDDKQHLILDNIKNDSSTVNIGKNEENTIVDKIEQDPIEEEGSEGDDLQSDDNIKKVESCPIIRRPPPIPKDVVQSIMSNINLTKEENNLKEYDADKYKNVKNGESDAVVKNCIFEDGFYENVFDEKGV
eukprot:UN27091